MGDEAEDDIAILRKELRNLRKLPFDVAERRFLTFIADMQTAPEADTQLVVTLTTILESKVIKRELRFSATTGTEDLSMLLAIEQAINSAPCLRAHVRQ